MARLNRLVVPGQAHHVSLTAVRGAEVFTSAREHDLFIEALRRAASEHRVTIHAHVLLGTGLQLLVTPGAAQDLGRMMQALSRFYVGPFNRRQGRSGALWQSRYRAGPVGGSAELLLCMRYIEQAPRGAGWAGAMAEYLWSSAAYHAGAQGHPFLAPVPPASGYWLLGNTPFEREAAYTVLLESPLASDQLARVEATTLKGWAMGSGEFIASLATEASRRPVAQARGRPRKVA